MNDPAIVYPRNPLTSRTIWLNLIGAPIAYLVTKYGLGMIFTPDLVQQMSELIVTGIMAAANIAFRWFLTTGVISTSAPLFQTPPVPLPSSTTVTVVTSAAGSPEPATVTKA
jgi:hypothetical protein